jgi:hypothetical protein
LPPPPEPPPPLLIPPVGPPEMFPFDLLVVGVELPPWVVGVDGTDVVLPSGPIVVDVVVDELLVVVVVVEPSS